jgi:magnesium transporter
MPDRKTTFDADMPSVDFDSLYDRVLQLIGEDDHEGLTALLAEHHPSDLATMLERIQVVDLVPVVFRSIPDEVSGEVLASLPDALRDDLLEELSDSEIAEAVTETAPDDAADIVEDLPEEQREEVLREVPPEQRAEIEELMAYEPDTAGGLMSPRFTAFRADLTKQQVFEELSRIDDTTSEQIYYLYVVEEDNVLVGVVTLRQLLRLPSTKRVCDVMTTPVRSVEAHEDQEKVAHMFGEYDLLALPVVDNKFRIIGVITVDDILDVREEENTEDVQKLVGAGGDERVDSPLGLSMRRRLPWLVVNLGTAFVASVIVAALQGAVKLAPAVAFFMPVVAGIGGNTGAQSLAVVFRSVILEEGGSRLVRRILLRSTALGFLNGVFISTCSAMIAYAVMALSHEISAEQRLQIAQVIGMAMLLSMTFASMVGAGIPLLMRRLGLDPAQNANILLTGITDMTGLGIYLGLILMWMGPSM